jgi:PAS domain S-box-containing protein
MAEPSDDNHEDIEGREDLFRLREMFAQSPSFSALLDGPEHRFVLTNPAYQQLIGHRDVVGMTVREAIPEVESQGLFHLLDEAFVTGKPFIGKNVEVVLQKTAGGAAESRFLDFVYQPIRDASGNVTSIFVEGSDVTERHATEDACGPQKPVSAN